MQARALFPAFLCLLLLGRTEAQAQQSAALPPGTRPGGSGESYRLSADGTKLLFVRNATEGTCLYFYNTTPLALADSVLLKGDWRTASWSGSGDRLLLHGQDRSIGAQEQLLVLDNAGRELRRIDLPASDSFPDLRYKLLNYAVDSAGREASAILYSLPESGAAYGFELNTLAAEPKAYHFQLARIDLESGRVVNRMPIEATFLTCVGYRKGLPLLLKGTMTEKYQSVLDLVTADVAAGRLQSLGAESLLRNKTLEQVSVFTAAQLYLEVENGIYRYDEDAGFRQLFYQPLGRSKSLRLSVQDGKLLLLGEAQRYAENELWLLDADGTVLQHNDLRADLPALAFRLRDTVRTIQFDNNRMLLRARPAPATAVENRQLLVQLPFEAEERLRLPGTPYLVEYNNKEWQVLDLEAQLVVYRHLADDYGQRFVALEGQPYLVRYTSQRAEVLRVGDWERPAGELPLQHAALGTGSSLYQGLIELKSLAWNPATQLLSGVFQSDSSYYMALWQQKPFWKLSEVLRIGKEFPYERSLWEADKEQPISKVECIATVAFGLSEAGWRLPAAQLTRQVLEYAARWSLPPSVRKEKIFSANQQKGSIAQRRILCSYNYKGSSGYFLADLDEPARSVYFAAEPRPDAFSKFGYVALPKDWQVYGFGLSDKGSVATLLTFTGTFEYDAARRKSTLRKAPGKYPNISTSSHFLLEATGLLLGNDDWLDRFTLQSVRKPAAGLLSDSAIYDPVARRLIVNRSTGDHRYVELRFDRLQAQLREQAPLPLLPRLRSDSTVTFYMPGIGYWAHIGGRGISLDSGRRAYNNTPGRLFRSDLNGAVDFVQVLPGNEQAVIGSTAHGLYECWNLRTEQRLFRIFLNDAENFVLQAPSGYYYATPGAVPQIGFQRSGRGIPAQWIDAELNRPDQVLAEMADTSVRDVATLLKLFRAAAQKKAVLSLHTGAAGSPQLALSTTTASRTTVGALALDITGKAGKLPLRHLRLYDNQVPVWDTLFTKPQQAFAAQLPIELVSGDNQLVLVATDEGGNSSLPAFRRVVYAPEKPVPARTWIITVAVNHYADTARSLRFAVKDGKDLLAAFRNLDPAHTVTDSLFDADVTVDNLRALHQKLLGTAVDDRVVLSFSGHGMLDTSYSFYYGTAPMDFGDPKKYGFSFAEMEGLLTGIPARRRLLLIDACNSGNVERETVAAVPSAAGVQVQHSLPPGSRGVVVPRPEGMNNAQVFSRLYSMSSGQSGAEIIAATAGNAFAYESEQWQNGVFTYSILQALQNADAADENYDNGLSVRELKRYVYPKVLQLTGGRQQPLARFENAGYDWNLLQIPEEQQ